MNDSSKSSNCRECKYTTSCFKELLDENIDSNNIHYAHIKYLRRQTLCKEGEFASSMKVILSGYVMLLSEGPDKKNFIVKILSAGDLLGVSAICGDNNYCFSAVALSDTLVCSIEKDSVVDLLSTNGSFALELTKWYCSNYCLLFGKIKTIGFKNLHGRMADAILYLDRPEFKDDTIYKYLSRRDIANLACIPMESAVRILSEFSDSKIIRTSGKEIEILDHEMLNRISRGG